MKRVILVGKGASGKDHARKIFEKRGSRYSISHTTRPPRTGEIDGKDYHFVSEDEFKKRQENGDFYETAVFNGWFYGTSKDEFDKSSVLVMTPSGISNLKPEDRASSVVIFFDVPQWIRKERMALRRDADSVERRLETDEKDFENFTDYDIRVTNFDF